MMKLSIIVFLSLFISTLAVKAQVSSDGIDIYSNDEQFDESKNGMKTDIFQYKPSERLKEMENNLSDDLKKFVKDGNVKETLTHSFLNSMNMDIAVDGLAKTKQELKQMINGPEASWVIGIFGEDLNKIFTSSEGANIINMISSTLHVLLTKVGERNNQESNLGKLLSSSFSLCSSPRMPEIVDKTGELATTIVNKPNAALFTRTFWNELRKSLSQKDLDKKLNNYFVTLSTLMKSLNNQRTKITQQV